MKAEIISIGDELLIGQVINTNSAWISKQLNNVGFDIHRVTTISDDALEIVNSLKEALSRVDIVLMTGGLGPTKDDITKATLAEFFGTEMVFNQSVIDNITKLFANRPGVLNKLNQSQAMVPKDCTIFTNKCGTAPIMLFEKDGKVVVSMPGVPSEMQMAMSDDIIPFLQKRFQTDCIFHYTINTFGLSESLLAETISDWEDALPDYIKLAYLPAAGKVRLRLTAHGKSATGIELATKKEAEKLIPLIGANIIGYGDEDPYKVLAEQFKSRKLTLAVAESCTGGYISENITKSSGASHYFRGSVVAYHNDIKTNILGVPAQTIAQFGAVSQEVVEAMALGSCKAFATDYAVATSGIAGPDGGTPEKPVGTIWIAIAKSNGEVVSELLQLGNINVRERNIIRAADTVIIKLLKMIH
ncbi:MAG: competence/damage-inducible protein A [Breznakibacter sp.]|nr:competence/damage-inducible protein A [Breznakibacter sp.]